MMDTLGIYVHVPFCARKCSYCDFASYANCLGELPGYLRRLEDEIGRSRDQGALAQSVYIGGGTPSLLSGEQLWALLGCLKEKFRLAPDAEISMEANPGTVTPEKLRAYREAGVNRLSIGVQAKQAHLLEMLGRIHRWDEAVEAVRMARAAGFQNINVDLMYALPGQTLEDWVESVRAVMGLGVEHVSAYGLILEEGTNLTRRVERGELSEVDDEICLRMQRVGTRLLQEHGYERYEISNYAKPGFECRHNVRYWVRGDYIGFGAAAHSLVRGVRWWNDDALCYEQRQGEEFIDEAGARDERIMLGTRMSKGIGVEDLDMRKVQRFVEMGFVECDGARMRLTEKGMEVHNEIVSELV